MMEMVYVGKQRLVGEVIGITSAYTTIQCYEETTGLMPGDPVEGTHTRMNLLLGPGILDNIFDGIERPLAQIEKDCGAFINRGSSVSPLDPDKEWDVTITVKVGDMLKGGMIYATTPETHIITHKMMVPPTLSGKVKDLQGGRYHYTALLEDGSVIRAELYPDIAPVSASSILLQDNPPRRSVVSRVPQTERNTLSAAT